MRAYGNIHTSFWTDPMVQSWPLMHRHVAAYLLTSPHSSLIGCYRLPVGYASDDLGLDRAEVENALSALDAAGFIAWDRATGWVWLRNWMKFNQFPNHNTAQAAVKLMAALPAEISFLPEFFAHMIGAGRWFHPGRRDTVAEIAADKRAGRTPPDPSRNGSADPGETVSEPLNNGSDTVAEPFEGRMSNCDVGTVSKPYRQPTAPQEQEQEQEQDKTNTHTSVLAGAKTDACASDDCSADSDADVPPTNLFGHPVAKPPGEIRLRDCVKIWNEVCGERFGVVHRMSENRQKLLRARLRKDFGTLESWRAYCVRMTRSTFLTGGSERGWTPNFDWAIKEANALKVLEGYYDDNRRKRDSGGSQLHSII